MPRFLLSHLRGLTTWLTFVGLVLGTALAQSPSAPSGTLRYGAAYDHGSLDPQLLSSVGDRQMANNVFEGLVRYVAGGTVIEPSLASDWVHNESGTDWTFNLVQGVQFHKDFGELTAEDVVFTIERLLDPELNSPNRSLMASVVSVTAPSKYQVRFELSEPDPAFLDKLANWFTFIVSKEAVEERGDSFGDDPVGTGPYQFGHWLPQQETVLTAFQDYWRGPPALAEVAFISIPDPTTMYNAFESGDVDIIFVTDADKLKRYANDSSIGVDSVPGLITRFFGMNTDFQPFANAQVREAVTLAVDREGMMTYLFPGISTAADSILAPGVLHVKRGVVHYELDLERARRLLAEAGYPDGFSVTFSVPNIDRFTLPAAVIQENLAQIGIAATIEVIETQTYMATLQTKGYDMFILTRTQDATPDRTLYTWFHSSEIPLNNWAKVVDPDVDMWLDRATTITDEQERDELFGLVQQRIADGNFYYFIDHENMIFAYHDYVIGFIGNPQRSFRLDNVRLEGR